MATQSSTKSTKKPATKTQQKPAPKSVKFDAKSEAISVEGNEIPIKTSVLTSAKRVLDWVVELNKNEKVSPEAVSEFISTVDAELFEGALQDKIC